MGKRATENTEAYQLYLKGRYYWNRRTADMLKKANDYFQQAIEKDPGYGLAYGGLAESYALFNYYGVHPPAQSCPKARAAASKAMEIDSSLLEPHSALGWVKMSCDWDWIGSEREFKRALEINPNYGSVRGFYSGYLKAMGRLEEAIAEERRGLEAEPLNLNLSTVLGRDLYFAGHDDEAIQELRKLIDMDATFVDAHLHLGWIYERKGMIDEAIAQFRQALSLSGGDPRFLSSLGHAYAISGQRQRAEESLVRLKEQSKQRYVAPYDIAVVHAGLKQTDETFKYLELAYLDHSFWLIWLRVDPRFDGNSQRSSIPGPPAAHASHPLTTPLAHA